MGARGVRDVSAGDKVPPNVRNRTTAVVRPRAERRATNGLVLSARRPPGQSRKQKCHVFFSCAGIYTSLLGGRRYGSKREKERRKERSGNLTSPDDPMYMYVHPSVAQESRQNLGSCAHSFGPGPSTHYCGKKQAPSGLAVNTNHTAGNHASMTNPSSS